MPSAESNRGGGGRGAHGAARSFEEQHSSGSNRRGSRFVLCGRPAVRLGHATGEHCGPVAHPVCAPRATGEWASGLSA
eukprot:6658284-Prymnesium_polylepis.2